MPRGLLGKLDVVVAAVIEIRRAVDVPVERAFESIGQRHANAI